MSRVGISKPVFQRPLGSILTARIIRSRPPGDGGLSRSGGRTRPRRYSWAARDASETYKSIAVPGFPNYFFATGPNGLVLDVPYFTSVEQNVATITRLLAELRKQWARSMGVRDDVNRAYNDWMLTRFPIYSWGSESCNSHYRFDNGRAPFLFPGNFKRYAELHAECGLADFELA